MGCPGQGPTGKEAQRSRGECRSNFHQHQCRFQPQVCQVGPRSRWLGEPCGINIAAHLCTPQGRWSRWRRMAVGRSAGRAPASASASHGRAVRRSDGGSIGQQIGRSVSREVGRSVGRWGSRLSPSRIRSHSGQDWFNPALLREIIGRFDPCMPGSRQLAAKLHKVLAHIFSKFRLGSHKLVPLSTGMKSVLGGGRLQPTWGRFRVRSNLHWSHLVPAKI